MLQRSPYAMIQQDTQHTLNIYRASAGSGKTHLLTGFYIKLLFDRQLLPMTHSGEMKFSEILAVTFTNKATAEMKDRIIQELFLLSTQPKESNYWEDIVAPGTPKTDVKAQADVSRKATQLLVQILNEYASFNISTIDSFFQKIVRSFARELNVPGNYEVELDANRVLDTAVSNVLDKLDDKTDAHLFGWMEEFMQKGVEDASGWDVRKALLNIARQVFESEVYRRHSQAIETFTEDHAAISHYAKMLRDEQRQWRDEHHKLAKAALDVIASHGLEAGDFKGKGNGTVKLLMRWADGSEEQPKKVMLDCAENPDNFFAKTKKKGEVLKSGVESVKEPLQQCVIKCISHVSGPDYIRYRTACAIREHFYELGIMASIAKEVNAYCNEQNIMLLSNTTDLLSRLIEKDDAPFIYEKTGTRIHSYMIDEFQDTSGMQWGNFKPLVSNSISEGYQNLIVGDVKQSIYRWRGGDWNLLNSEINSYEPAVHHDDSTSLRDNWRSLTAIIGFNNAFFPQLAAKLDSLLYDDCSLISGIYADVEQYYPQKKKKEHPDLPPGLVKIEFLQPAIGENGKPLSNKQVMLDAAAQRLPEVIIKLEETGFEPRDIAILCREKDECSWAAEVLLRYKQEHKDSPWKFDIISNEALKLSSRPAIHTIISLMRHLQTPASPILCAIARTSLMQLEGMTADEALAHFFALRKEERPFHTELAHRPLYEMVEALITYLPQDVQQAEMPFLQGLRDHVLEFASRQGSDLAGFLEWWDEAGYKKSIATPEGQNAIQILTVHSSKGLGMPAVVMPFASWDLDLNTAHKELIWCQPTEGAFKCDVPLPLSLNEKLENTIFAPDFREERARALIDNINTVYVAFTRAKEALVILAPEPKKEDPEKSKKTNTMLERWLKDFCDEHGDTFGCWQRPVKSEKKKQDKSTDTPADKPAEQESNKSAATPADNPAEQEPSKPAGQEPSKPAEQDPSQASSAAESSSPTSQPAEPALPSSTASLPAIKVLHDPTKPDVTAKERGTYIHAVLQEIRTANDAAEVISRLYKRGDIDSQVISLADMSKTIRRLLSLPRVQPWFRPGLQVLNELSLVDNEGQLRRPDRVIIAPDGVVTVIDYKTGDRHAGYYKQVAAYMQALSDMGFSNVEGYIFYIKEEKIIKIRCNPSEAGQTV